MNQILKDRVAIVTGAAQGAGKGVALGLAKCGAKVVILDIQRERGLEARDELRAAGLVAEFIETNLMSEISVNTAVEQAAAFFGRLDILASCAGIYPFQTIDGMTTDEWNRVMTVNLMRGRQLHRHSLRAGVGPW